MRRPRPRPHARRSLAPYLAALLVFLFAAATGIVYAIHRRYEHVATEDLQSADELFHGGSFSKAERAYQLFRRDHARDDRAARATALEELSKVAQSLNEEAAPPDSIIQSLKKIQTTRAPETNFSEHWDIIETLVERRTRALLERANRTAAAADLSAAREWLSWIGEQQTSSVEFDFAELEALERKAEARVAGENRRATFITAAERAIAGGTAADFQAAFRAHDQWRIGSTGPDNTVATTFERLRIGLRQLVRFQPPPDSTPETPPALPLLSLEPYTVLSSFETVRPLTRPPREPVFARVKDLCFAVDPATGKPLWLARVGYDAPLPQLASTRSTRSVLVPWFKENRAILSRCDAATGETIWSWESEDPLAGPVSVTRDSVLIVTVSGRVWQLDLESGEARHVAVLPEPVDSPPALREDRSGLCLVGASQAIYLLDVGRDLPECSDVILLGRRSDSDHSRALWEPPYVIIFENDMVDRCYVRVLFQEAAGYRVVREVELPGRLWQPPALDGARLFLVTDRWKKHCFGLDRGNSAVNLFTAASGSQAQEPAVPVRPYYASVSVEQAPFLGVTDALRGYRVDDERALLTEAWARAAPTPAMMHVQPLQTRDSLVVTTWQDPSQDGVLLQGVDARQGEVIWTSRLGSSAREIGSLQPESASGRDVERPSRLVVRSGIGELFRMQRDSAGHWSSESLKYPRSSSNLIFSRGEQALVYTSDGATRLQIIDGQTGSARPFITLRSAPQSPLTLDRGILQGAEASGASQSSSDAESALFVSTDRRLESQRLSDAGEDIHGVSLPKPDGPEGVWKWPPLIFDSQHVVVAHPSGLVSLLEVRRTDDISHFLVRETRKDLSALAAAPIGVAVGEGKQALLCVGKQGKCSVLDADTLKTIATWDARANLTAAARSVDPLPEGGRAFLMVDGSKVQCVDVSDKQLSPRWQRALPGSDWKIADTFGRWLVVYHSSGRIEGIDTATGDVGWSHTAPATLSAPPYWSAGGMALSTIDGGIHLVPIPTASERQPETSQ